VKPCLKGSFHPASISWPAEAGLAVNDIVQIRLYLTDLSELPELNEVYKKYFTHPFPARTAIGVAKLPLGASLEIEAIATR
jgi:2-iminobutanoate/2-iminopropanoate deaminase